MRKQKTGTSDNGILLSKGNEKHGGILNVYY